MNKDKIIEARIRTYDIYRRFASKILANPKRSHPAQSLAKTFDGPPTLERSGSEHRVGRLHP